MEWNNFHDVDDDDGDNMTRFRSRLETDGAEPRQAARYDIIYNNSCLTDREVTSDYAPLHTKKPTTSPTTCTPSIPTYMKQQQEAQCDIGYNSGVSSRSDLENQVRQMTISNPVSEPPAAVCQEEQLSQILQFADDVYCQNEEGDTRLHSAVIHDMFTEIGDILRLTLCQDALNIRNKLGQTALHLAIIMVRDEMARTLMTCGASLDARDNDGRTPLHVACELGNILAIKTLTQPIEEYEKRMTDLLYQVQDQTVPQNGDIRNYQGETCIHVAAKHGHQDIVEHLVEKCGYDVNAQESKAGKTILHMAIENENLSMIEFLLKHKKVNPYLEDFKGDSPFLLAHYHVGALAVVHKVFPHLREMIQEDFYEAMSDEEDSNPVMNGH